MAEPRGGVLVLDKPSGMTSHDVVAAVRRALGRGVRVGHTGTLDPFATGVLPLVVGACTRLAQFFSVADKVYDASLRLGWSTDTYDVTGTRIESTVHTGPWPDRETVERTVARFVGPQQQVPPPFSAKKSGGTPAYVLARKGRQVELPAVDVTVHTLEVLAWEPEHLRLRVHCAAGYYVRSLAHDIGQALSVGAHLDTLRRVRTGDFDEAAAVSLERVMRDPDGASAWVVPPETLLTTIPAVTVTETGRTWVSHGRPLQPEWFREAPGAWTGERVRILGPDGQLLAIGRPLPDGTLHPGLVLG